MVSQSAAARSASAFDIFSKTKERYPVSRVFEYGGHTSGMPVFYVGLESILEGGKKASGVGVHRNHDRAFFYAMLELLERRTLAAASNKSFLKDARGTPYVKGWALSSGEEVELPIQAVFWDYDFKAEQDSALAESNVNGSGIAFSKEEAVAFGIYECIERDSLLLHWLAKITPPRVDPGSVGNDEINFLINEAKRRGLETYILDITSDIPIPAYLVVFTGHDAPIISLGSSANLDALAALKKALYEAWGNYILSSLLSERPELLERAGSIAKERYLSWLAPSTLEHSAFLFGGSTVPLRRRKVSRNELEMLKTILAGRGLESYVYESSRECLGESGLHAVKVVMPQLIPFYFREENAKFALAHERLCGRVKNTFPHPFT